MPVSLLILWPGSYLNSRLMSASVRNMQCYVRIQGEVKRGLSGKPEQFFSNYHTLAKGRRDSLVTKEFLLHQCRTFHVPVLVNRRSSVDSDSDYIKIKIG